MRTMLFLLLTIICCRGAAQLNGSFDYFQSFADTPSMSITGTISIAIWCSKTAGINVSAGLIGKGRNGDNTKLNYEIRNSNDQFDWFYQSPDGTLQVWRTTSAFTQTNTPMHVAVTFTYGNSNSVAFYVNGTNCPGVWVSFTGNTIGLTNSQVPRIGATVAALWFGTIDEAAIWNGILTPGQIAALASTRVKGGPLLFQGANLVTYCAMDDRPDLYNSYSALLQFTDRSGHGNSWRDGGNGPGNPVKRGSLWFSYPPNE